MWTHYLKISLILCGPFSWMYIKYSKRLWAMPIWLISPISMITWSDHASWSHTPQVLRWIHWTEGRCFCKRLDFRISSVTSRILMKWLYYPTTVFAFRVSLLCKANFQRPDTDGTTGWLTWKWLQFGLLFLFAINHQIHLRFDCINNVW